MKEPSKEIWGNIYQEKNKNFKYRVQVDDYFKKETCHFTLN